MKKLNLFLVGLILFGSSIGQKTNNCPTYIGVKAGLSIPNLMASSNDPLSKGYKSRLGLDAGAFIELPINNHFSFQTGLNYSEQGGKRNGYQAIAPVDTTYFPAGSYAYSDVKNTAKFNYLLLPVQVKYKYELSKKINVYATAGFFGGFILSAKNIVKGNQPIDVVLPNGTKIPSGENMSDLTQDIKSDIHKFNFGFIGNIGFEYVFSKGKFFIEGGGNYGFIPLQKDAANGKNTIGAGTVSVGYAMKLK
jgi:hypothetical protein